MITIQSWEPIRYLSKIRVIDICLGFRKQGYQAIVSRAMKIAFDFLLVPMVLLMAASCSHTPKEALFVSLDARESGIGFRNDIREDDSSASFINEFGYMGGGVGIGDFNNDGLKDIFFTGNQVSSRLYINKGDNRFEDITGKAGVGTHAWATGVSIVDINNDGYDDIYVCVFGKDLYTRAQNLLFINQHNLTFKEQAAEYGLADTGYSTQALFFDGDNDGDLDMYLTHYLLNGPNPNNIYSKDTSGRSPANDKLYRNDGYSARLGHPVFTDISQQAGIREDGYGLGVVASDLNNDGWPDLYIANDFLSNDELWLNNKNGHFTNSIASSMGHQSYSSMGVDAADINNDGLPDIVTLDMLPECNERRKQMFSFMNYDRYQRERSLGYEPEFMRNMLQLNNGNRQVGKTTLPFFSEIGQLAGISATDWSWSVLLADFDNDGWKDMHITNGIGRDFINADFLEFSSTIFAGGKTQSAQRKLVRDKLASLDHINLGNYLYRNNHDDTFLDISEKAGVHEPSMSNGAAYVDLDNDGDLDLVVNNINREAFVFINNTLQKEAPPRAHYLRIVLAGDSNNTKAFGSRVMVYTKGMQQVQEQNPVRGYFSSVDQTLVFGLGAHRQVDSVVVQWPGHQISVRKNIPADTSLVFDVKNAASFYPVDPVRQEQLFEDVTDRENVLYKHTDYEYNDFDVQRLLPQKYSQLGPFLAKADINGDGLEDFFAGGAFNSPGRVFMQQTDGRFAGKPLTDSIKMEEDQACVFLDANKDGYPDLLVTSGDMRYGENAVYNRPRLYLNDGRGHFALQRNAFPASVSVIAGAVSVGDYDGDGYPDVFIGGRVSKQYPVAPRSFLLRNDRGVFTDVTAAVCPELEYPGMVTASVWMDVDKDHQPDLIIAGEWMPIRFFKNNKGHLQEVTTATGLTGNTGMWRSLAMADIDNDGDMDLVAGNLGLNCIYQVSAAEPMQLFAADIDGNGSIDPVLCYYNKDAQGKKHLYPAVNKSQLAEQVPTIKKQFLYNKDYALATVNDVFKGKAKDRLELTCAETRSCYFENKGDGKFVKHALPMAAQFAPVNTIVAEDIDNDGHTDLVLAGNEYQADVITGRYDALYGCYLKGDGKGFTAIPAVKSGFILPGDTKHMTIVHTAQHQRLLVAAVNNDSLRVFKIR